MLHEEVALYKKLTGSNEENIPIMKIGAYLDGYNKGLEDAKPKWIPVSERLPEYNYACLVTVLALPKEDQGIVYPDYVGWDGEAWANSDGCVIPFEVVAWMPLPEPFKEARNDE